MIQCVHFLDSGTIVANTLYRPLILVFRGKQRDSILKDIRLILSESFQHFSVLNVTSICIYAP